MSAKNIFGVAVRVVGLVLMLLCSYFLLNALGLLVLAPGGPGKGVFLSIFALNALFAWVGLSLLRKADWVVEFAFAEPDSEPGRPHFELPEASPSGRAYLDALRAEGRELPRTGTIYLSLKDADLPWIQPHAARLCELGYKLVATGGTARSLSAASIRTTPILDLASHPGTLSAAIAAGEVQMVFLTKTPDSPALEAAQEYGVYFLASRTAISKMVEALVVLHAERDLPAEED